MWRAILGGLADVVEPHLAPSSSIEMDVAPPDFSTWSQLQQSVTSPPTVDNFAWRWQHEVDSVPFVLSPQGREPEPIPVVHTTTSGAVHHTQSYRPSADLTVARSVAAMLKNVSSKSSARRAPSIDANCAGSSFTTKPNPGRSGARGRMTMDRSTGS